MNGLFYFTLQFRNFKIVYRRYAGLYFCICVDISDNNLAYLEAIHNFVEVLNEYFHNVCELDLVFNFYKVRKGQKFGQVLSFVDTGWLRLRLRHRQQMGTIDFNAVIGPEHF